MKVLSSFLVILHLLFGLAQLGAQDNSLKAEVTSLFKINILLPGLSYEQKMGKFSTLNSDIYLDALLLSANESFNGSFRYFYTPSFKVEYRTYYNMIKRSGKGLRTAINNGNYYAPVYIARWSPTSEYGPHAVVSQLAGVWGMHRTSPAGFSFDINAGLVYTFHAKTYNFYSPVQPMVQLRLGYCLGGKLN